MGPVQMSKLLRHLVGLYRETAGPQLSRFTAARWINDDLDTPVPDVAPTALVQGLYGDATRNGSLMFHELSAAEQ